MPIAVLTVVNADLAALRSGMLAWSTGKNVSFALAGCEGSISTAMMNVLVKMVDEQAFPESWQRDGGHIVVHSHEVETLRCMESLVALGSKFFFTQLGAQSLRHVRMCAAPMRFFKSPSELVDIPQKEWCYCSAWELLQLLCANNWQLRRAPPPKVLKQQPLQALKPDAYQHERLFWYLRSVHVQNCKPYMLALLRAKQLFANSELLELHRCQPMKYYERVLDGKSNGCLAILSLEDRLDAAPRFSLALDVAEDSDRLPVHADRCHCQPGLAATMRLQHHSPLRRLCLMMFKSF